MNDFYLFKDRTEWRAWLEANFESSKGIWLGYYKKHTGKPTVSYNEAVEEALCFGWIDSLTKKVDERIYKQKFTPRKKGSVWSQTNVQRVEEMIKEGLMTDAGLMKVAEAKKNGQWEKAYGSNKEELVPEDFLRELKKSKTAFTNFFNYTLSVRNRYIHRINQAKRPETRNKRIYEIVSFSENNIKPGF
jgi:uncharacterized protein YdeI (YjbR/CyaY-like superfamily)